MITTIMQGWRDKGLATRRDWWNVLAGTEAGKARTDSGFTFPVLAAARRRKGWPPVDAEQRRPGETPAPPIVESGRWPKPKAKRRPKAA